MTHFYDTSNKDTVESLHTMIKVAQEEPTPNKIFFLCCKMRRGSEVPHVDLHVRPFVNLGRLSAELREKIEEELKK